MAKFTKADAKKAGWTFTHNAGPKVTGHSETQHLTRSEPADLRAEKYLGPSQRIEEQAETEEQLLARIEAYEQHLASREA
jgi:hypothetical protein